MIRKRLSKSAIACVVINCILIAVVVKFYSFGFWETAEKEPVTLFAPVVLNGQNLVEQEATESATKR